MSAKCCRKSIYFLSLEIENARCFAENQVLDLTDSNNRPARWTLLVGDNGVGKTTLLQCLSWMRPVPHYQPAGGPIGIQPWLNDRDPPDMERLFRDGASRTVLQAEMVEIPTLDSLCSSTARVRTGITLGAKNNKLEGRAANRKRAREDGRPVRHSLCGKSVYGESDCRRVA